MHGRTRNLACQAVTKVHLVHQERAAPWWLVLAPGQSPETQIWGFKSALLGRCLVWSASGGLNNGHETIECARVMLLRRGFVFQCAFNLRFV